MLKKAIVVTIAMLTVCACHVLAAERKIDDWAENGHERLAHPFMLADTGKLARLSEIGADEPWKTMRAEAIKQAESVVFSNPSSHPTTRFTNVFDIVNYNMAACLLGGANTEAYKKKVLDAISLFDPDNENTLYGDLYKADGDNWNGAVPPGNAFASCVLALDILYPSLSSAEILAAEAALEAVSDNFWAATEVHLVNTWGVRGIWAVYQQDWALARRCYDEYRLCYNESFGEDGGQLCSQEYAYARFAASERTAKILLPYITEYMGLTEDFYSDPKVISSMEYLMGYSYTPTGEFWSIGGTLMGNQYDPRSLLGAYAAHNYSETAAAYGAFALGNTYGAGTLLKLILGNEDGTIAEKQPPKSRIFPNTAAFLYEDYDSKNTLAGFLYNPTGENHVSGHMHKEVNSIGLYGYGEMLMANAGYNYFRNDCDGFTWTYIASRAISSNTVMLNYDYGNIKNPSAVNDHAAYYGNGITHGFLNPLLSWARGDSPKALAGGVHERTLTMVSSQDGVPGYFVTFDEVKTGREGDVAMIVQRPMSEVYAEISKNAEYEWTINRQRRNDVKLSVFMANEPSSVEFVDGVVGGDASKHGYVNIKSLLSRYVTDENGEVRVATILFPSDASNPKPDMKRISYGGVNGASIDFGRGIRDYVFTSPSGESCYRITEPGGDDYLSYDYLKFDGRNIIVRKNNGALESYFGEDAKLITCGNEGFRAEEALSVFIKNGKGNAEADRDTRVTFYAYGIQGVKVNGAALPLEKAADGAVTVIIPSGRNELEFVIDADKALTQMLSGKTVNAMFDRVLAIDAKSGRAICQNKIIETGGLISEATAYVLRSFAEKEFGYRECAPVFFGGKAYVPLKSYAEALGFDVMWLEPGIVFAAPQGRNVDPVNDAPAIGLALRAFGLLNETEGITKNSVTADMLYLNGEPIKDFDPATANYYLVSDNGQFDVSASAKYKVDIASANGLSTVSVSDGQYTSVYKVYEVMTVKPTRKENIIVTASEEPQPENGRGNTLDGDLSTRWSAEKQQWICFDMGEIKDVEAFYIAWGQGSVRYAKFDVEVSDNGRQWQKVFAGKSTGLTELPERVDARPFTARYIRVNCNGTSVGTWNSITEIEIRTKEGGL